MVIKAQESLMSMYFKLSSPEKFWVIKHPFIAKKTSRITHKALRSVETIASEFPIDNDLMGGQADAFKHSYWMALLAQSISAKKARQLGEAHEKANYIQYQKGILEDGSLPDKASFEMDIWNNKVGIYLGKQYKQLNEEELKIKVIEYLLKGEMKIIKKDKSGNYLDCKGVVIEKELLNKWDNPKCHTWSDFRKAGGN